LTSSTISPCSKKHGGFGRCKSATEIMNYYCCLVIQAQHQFKKIPTAPPHTSSLPARAAPNLEAWAAPNPAARAAPDSAPMWNEPPTRRGISCCRVMAWGSGGRWCSVVRDFREVFCKIFFFVAVKLTCEFRWCSVVHDFVR
jgi:hypothetical protein